MKVEEYRRTCKSCGKVWHSLVEREKKIQNEMTINQRLHCFYCCNDEVASQYARNKEANETDLDRLKKCPECQSSNYEEEIITFKK